MSFQFPDWEGMTGHRTQPTVLPRGGGRGARASRTAQPPAEGRSGPRSKRYVASRSATGTSRRHYPQSTCPGQPGPRPTTRRIEPSKYVTPDGKKVTGKVAAVCSATALAVAVGGTTIDSAAAESSSTERYIVVASGSSVSKLSLPAAAADDVERFPGVGAMVADLTPAQASSLDAQRGVSVAPDARVRLVPDRGFDPKAEKADGAPLTSLRGE